MPILQIVGMLMFVGILLWGVSVFPYCDAGIKKLIQIVVVSSRPFGSYRSSSRMVLFHTLPSLIDFSIIDCTEVNAGYAVAIFLIILVLLLWWAKT